MEEAPIAWIQPLLLSSKKRGLTLTCPIDLGVALQRYSREDTLTKKKF